MIDVLAMVKKTCKGLMVVGCGILGAVLGGAYMASSMVNMGIDPTDKGAGLMMLIGFVGGAAVSISIVELAWAIFDRNRKIGLLKIIRALLVVIVPITMIYIAGEVIELLKIIGALLVVIVPITMIYIATELRAESDERDKIGKDK